MSTQRSQQKQNNHSHMSISRSDDDGGSSAVPTTGPTPSPPAFPLLGITVRRLGRFVDEFPGGRQSLAGLEMYKLWHGGVLDPMSDPTKPSLCERLQAEGDAGVGIATWFVSYTAKEIFLDLLDALEIFFEGEAQGLDTVVWFCKASNRLYPRCPTHNDIEGGTAVLKHAVQGTRNLVMFMSTWDKPSALTRAWCLWELSVCCSCGGRVEFALPRAQRVQLMEVMRSNPATFFDIIASLRSENCTDTNNLWRVEVFAAISAEVGFSGLDAMVRRALWDWMERLLRAKIEEARGAGKEEEAAGLLIAVGMLHSHRGG
jgi:hypothetical protein